MSTHIYKSQTHGPIPLSFTGKHLMKNLRDAIVRAISRGSYAGNGCGAQPYENDVAYARGELAQYISSLEARSTPDSGPTVAEIMAQAEPPITRKQVADAAIDALMRGARRGTITAILWSFDFALSVSQLRTKHYHAAWKAMNALQPIPLCEVECFGHRCERPAKHFGGHVADGVRFYTKGV
jgi:hypothetical protein